MNQVIIDLTEEQKEAIEPLWPLVMEADLEGKKGAILIQPGKDFASCIFVPYEQSQKIREILKELE